MAKPILVDGYIRVSSVSGRAGDSFISPELQRESIERVCQKEGLQVQEWIEELDKSGGDASRPGWNYLIEKVEQGKSKGIVCWNLSRFSRSTKDALSALERVEQAGGRLYSEEGHLDKLSRTIRFAISEDERDRAKAGFRNAAASAIARGIYIAAHIPFGYLRDPETRRLLPDPEKAHIVEVLFEKRAKGYSWAQLTTWLQETHGIYRPRPSIQRIIHNPAYIGWARQVGKDRNFINEKAHEPLVSRLLFDQANKAKGRKPVQTGISEKLLLRGIVSCSNCGHKMIVGRTRDKPAYYCRNQACDDHAYSQAFELDEYVAKSLLQFLSSADAKVKNENDPQEIDKAEKELEEAQYDLDTFKSNKKAIGILGVDEWNKLLEEYILARDVAQTNFESLVVEKLSGTTDYELVPTLWNEWTNDSRREFLEKVILECSVTPAHRQKIPIHERVDLIVMLEAGAGIEITSPSGIKSEVAGFSL
jgi:site-specific DNA recombinase